MEICEIFKDIKKIIIVKLITDIPNNSKGICVYVTDSFLTYLYMHVVVVVVPNSQRKLGGIWLLNIYLSLLNRNWDYESDFKYMYLFFNLKYYPDILISETKYILSPLII
jgi:hypothetical protein